MTKPIATKNPPGIYGNAAAGYRVVACIGRGKKKRQGKRFPPKTAIRDMLIWQGDTETALRKASPLITPGTFADDVTRIYLPIKKATMPAAGYRQREQHMAFWVAELGAKKGRNDVVPAAIELAIARYTTTRAKPTGNRARTALMDFYHRLNGKSGYNPVRDVKRWKERRQPPPELTFDLYDRILAAMGNRGATYTGVRGRDGVERRIGQKVAKVSKTKLRIAMIAMTGLPHETIKQIEPSHIDWAGRRFWKVGRVKGKGTDPAWHPLSDVAMAALRAFADGDAFGRFSTSSMLSRFHAAADKVRAESPELFLGPTRITPNKLRHLFGSTLTVLAGRSVASDLMDHTSEATTKIYTEMAEAPAQRAALDKFDAYMAARQPAPPTTPAPTAAGAVWVNVVSGGCANRALRIVKRA